jgi:hypothetical protein
VETHCRTKPRRKQTKVHTTSSRNEQRPPRTNEIERQKSRGGNPKILVTALGQAKREFVAAVAYALAKTMPREKERHGELQLWPEQQQQTVTGPNNKQRDQNLRCHKPCLGTGNKNKIDWRENKIRTLNQLQNKNEHEEINRPPGQRLSNQVTVT